jgi:hypothetical protein
MLGASKQMTVTANVADRLPALRLVKRVQEDADPARAMLLLPERRDLEAAMHDQ